MKGELSRRTPILLLLRKLSGCKRFAAFFYLQLHFMCIFPANGRSGEMDDILPEDML